MYIIEKIQVDPNVSLKETLKALKDLEQKTLLNDEFKKFVLRTFKTQCFTCIPKLIYDYVRLNFNYQNDLYDEVIAAPYILLKTKTGDCDDFALFIKSCLTICGIESKYILFGSIPGIFSHIAVLSGGKIIDGVNPVFNNVPTKYKYFLKV